jgi:hypothetical protein
LVRLDVAVLSPFKISSRCRCSILNCSVERMVMLRLEFTKNLPAEVPSQLKIYSLEKARVDQSLFINVLSRLGLMGGFSGFRWRKNGGWTAVESKDARVSINHHSGAVRFWTRLNDRKVPSGPFSIDEPLVAF